MRTIRDHNGRLLQSKWERTLYVDVDTGEVRTSGINLRWIKKNAIYMGSELHTWEVDYVVWFQRIHKYKTLKTLFDGKDNGNERG